LQTTSEVAPVWVVETPDNKKACKRLWQGRPNRDHREKGAVTSYKVGDAEDRVANLLNVLPTLEEHHGAISDDQFSFPKGFTLEVIGLTPTDKVTETLREYGFSLFPEIPGGFQACK
jgi:hypothetical protein